MHKINNEFSNNNHYLNYSDIGKQINQSKIFVNERQTNLIFYIYFFPAIIIAIILFIMNSFISSKLHSLEVEYKEIEVNNQRDQNDL